MVIKGFSTFPESLGLKPCIRLFNVISKTFVGGVLPLCRDAVGVFYSPSWLEFIFTHNVFAVHYVSHNRMGTHPKRNLTFYKKIVNCVCTCIYSFFYLSAFISLTTQQISNKKCIFVQYRQFKDLKIIWYGFQEIDSRYWQVFRIRRTRYEWKAEDLLQGVWKKIVAGSSEHEPRNRWPLHQHWHHPWQQQQQQQQQQKMN